MDAGADYLDLVVRAEDGVFVGATPARGVGDRIELLGQLNHGWTVLPALLEVPLSEGGGRAEAPDRLRSILIAEEELTVERHTHFGDGGEVEVHAFSLAGDRWSCRASAVVDPLPLLPIFAAAALGGYAIHRWAQHKEMKEFREQWERDKRDCLESDGTPEMRISGSGKWEVDLSQMKMSLDPRVDYEFRCRR